jgi:hypothetical protein
MAVSLSLLAGAGWQFFDDNGVPLNGGLLYTYAAGTTTPLATYTSSNGVTANSNPIVLDSAGRVPYQVWLTVGSAYKFILKTSTGVTVWTEDNVFGYGSSADITFIQSGTGAVVRTAQNKMREWVSAEDFGVIGGGTVDDTVTLQAAITNAFAAGFKELRLTNPNGYRITSTITQPYALSVVGCRQLIRCEGITPGAGTPAWVVEYSSWSSNVDRFAFRTPLSDVVLRGNASPAAGVYTTNLYGVQIRAFHAIIKNVTCVGFDRAFDYAASVTGGGWLAWETKFNNCDAYYNKHGLYTDVAAAGGGAGAGITLAGGILAWNDYNLYNNCAEITLLDVASDAAVVAHVKDNITILSGNQIGFMHWQNCRMESGGAAGVAWVTNSGVMRFNNCFFTERNAADAIFNTAASGYTIVDGGTWRTSDGRYKATGAGIVTQRGVCAINNSNGVLLTYANSYVLNGDLNDGTTGGFTTTAGTVALTNVADATFLAAGRALNMVASVFPATVASAQIELDQGFSNFTLTFKANNANATVIPVTIKQYNRLGVMVSSASANIAANSSTIPYGVKHNRFPNSAYCVIEIGFTAGQTSAVRASDFYLTQW